MTGVFPLGGAAYTAPSKNGQEIDSGKCRRPLVSSQETQWLSARPRQQVMRNVKNFALQQRLVSSAYSRRITNDVALSRQIANVW
jgi:hypothetical protein